MAKEEKTNFCIEKFIQKEYLDHLKLLEKYGLSNLNVPLEKIRSITELYSDININFESFNDFFGANKNNFGEDISKINELLGVILIELSNVKSSLSSHNIHKFIYYCYFLTIRTFFTLLFYTDKEKNDFFSYGNEVLKIFLEKLFNLRKFVEKTYFQQKKYPDIFNDDYDFVSIFKSIPKDKIEHIIEKFQTYLTVYLFDITSTTAEVDEEYQPPTFNREEMQHLMETFNLFWKINKKHKFVDFKSFNNDTASKHFDINEECRIYNSNLTKIKKLENKMNIDSGNGLEKAEFEPKFTLINYNFLFDSSRKSDILYAFNYKTQRQELMNTLSSMIGNLNNPLNPGVLANINLLFEVRRNNLIEDTMNLVSNPQFNLKKALRVTNIP